MIKPSPARQPAAAPQQQPASVSTIGAAAALVMALATSAPAPAAEILITPAPAQSPSPRNESLNTAPGKLPRPLPPEQRDNPPQEIPSSAEEVEDLIFGGRPAAQSNDNRNRARSYQAPDSKLPPSATTQGGGKGTDPDRLLLDPDSNRGKVSSNLDRARTYQKGQTYGTPHQRTTDGEVLPLIDCGPSGSETGRIGDGSQSGTPVIIMRDNKALKARCK